MIRISVDTTRVRTATVTTRARRNALGRLDHSPPGFREMSDKKEKRGGSSGRLEHYFKTTSTQVQGLELRASCSGVGVSRCMFRVWGLALRALELGVARCVY